jgi:TolB-like protein/Tfp pilus assembly protein PilF
VTATVARPAIAILPFQDQSDDAAHVYLADGLTQDLIDSLGRFSGLTVMSWNAVASYKGAIAQPGEIARVLAVRYQVEGSLRYSGERLRVSAQLVDVQGRVLWSARFDEIAADVFALPDRIAREVAAALAIRIPELAPPGVAGKPPASFAAYDLLLRARPALHRPTRAGLAEARELLRQALALDPGYGAAHAALAATFHAAVVMGWAQSADEYWRRVGKHATDALRIDESNVQARVLLGRMHMVHERYAEAQLEVERALVINPNDAGALAARGEVLIWMGRTDAAIESLELAQRINPELDPRARFALSLAYYLNGKYDSAIEQARLNLEKTPDAHVNLVVLAAAYAQANQPAEAARTVTALKTRAPDLDALTVGSQFQNPKDLARLRSGLAKAGLSSGT